MELQVAALTQQLAQLQGELQRQQQELAAAHARGPAGLTEAIRELCASHRRGSNTAELAKLG